MKKNICFLATMIAFGTMFAEVAHICLGDTYIWHGEEFDIPGTYCFDTNQDSRCDGDTLFLYVHGHQSDEEIVANCSYTWHGKTYIESGIYTDSLIGIYGCDSIITLYLTIIHNDCEPMGDVDNLVGCDSIKWHGVTYTYSGHYYHGNDEAYMTIYQTSYSFDNPVTSYCSYNWNGKTYSTSGMYSDTLYGASIHGCDSVVFLDLTIISEDCNFNTDDESTFTVIDVIYTEQTKPGGYNDSIFFSKDSTFSFICIDPSGLLIRIEKDTCKFGTPEKYDITPCALLVESGAELNFSIPSDGILRIAPHMAYRNGSEICIFVVEQNGEILLSKITQESDKNGSVYPYVYVHVQQGNVKISIPNGAIIFHSFAFVKSEDSITSSVFCFRDCEYTTHRKVLHNGQIYILRGDKTYTLQGQEVR